MAPTPSRRLPWQLGVCRSLRSLGLLVAWQTTVAIFLAFVIAEAITAVIYHAAAVRYAPDYAEAFGLHRLRDRLR